MDDLKFGHPPCLCSVRQKREYLRSKSACQKNHTISRSIKAKLTCLMWHYECLECSYKKLFLVLCRKINDFGLYGNRRIKGNLVDDPRFFCICGWSKCPEVDIVTVVRGEGRQERHYKTINNIHNNETLSNTGSLQCCALKVWNNRWNKKDKRLCHQHPRYVRSRYEITFTRNFPTSNFKSTTFRFARIN